MTLNASELRTKYRMDESPQLDHPINHATRVVERTSGLVTLQTGDTAYLFDPALSPRMWQLTQRTMRDMRRLFCDEIEAAADTDTFLYYPCIPNLYVYEDAMQRFSYMITTRVPMPHAVGERGCDVQLAPEGCAGHAVYLPHEHGPFIVVFSICRACDAWARETAEVRFRSNVIGAQVHLPHGARVDPGSPVPPTP